MDEYIILVIIHFDQLDTNCSGDYHDITILINGILAQKYGDDYHDRGNDKVKGFLDGLCHVYGEENMVVNWLNLADRSI